MAADIDARWHYYWRLLCTPGSNTERFILENSPAGTKVGAPVTAFDDATRIDKLGYSTGGWHSAEWQWSRDRPRRSFPHRFEDRSDHGRPRCACWMRKVTTEYRVKVTAIDGDEALDSINVTIRVHDLNEGPKIPSIYLVAITDTGHEIGERVPTEMSHYEVDRRSSEYQAVRNTLRDEGDTTTDIPR